MTTNDQVEKKDREKEVREIRESKKDAEIKKALAFYRALSDEDREELEEDANCEKAAEVILPIFGALQAKLIEAGLPAGDVIIITSDGEMFDPETYNLDLLEDDEDDDDDEDYEDEDDDDDEDEEELDGRECLTKLRAFVKKQDKKKKGLSLKDTADELDISLRTIKTWLNQDFRRSDIKVPRQENCLMILDMLAEFA